MITKTATPQIAESGIKIVDIRTPMEWRQTGVVKNSILITFFDEFGRSKEEEFLKELSSHVDKSEQFAIICRTGHRTRMVGHFLSDFGYDVINLDGGVHELIVQGYELIDAKA